MAAIAMAYVFYVMKVSDSSVIFAGGFHADLGTPPNAPAKTGALLGGFTKKFTSQDAASAAGKSWNRQAQSAGEDTRMEVWGGPIGADVSGAVRNLTSDERKFQKYEGVDTIGLGLRQRIADANRISGAGGAGYSDDVAPEIVGEE